MRQLSELLLELGARGFEHGLQDLLSQVAGKIDNMSKAFQRPLKGRLLVGDGAERGGEGPGGGSAGAQEGVRK